MKELSLKIRRINVHLTKKRYQLQINFLDNKGIKKKKCIKNKRSIKEYYTTLNFYITFPFFISISLLDKEIMPSCCKSGMIHSPFFKFNESHINIASCCHNIHSQTVFFRFPSVPFKKIGDRLEQDIPYYSFEDTLLYSSSAKFENIYFYFIFSVKLNIMKVNLIFVFPT